MGASQTQLPMRSTPWARYAVEAAVQAPRHGPPHSSSTQQKREAQEVKCDRCPAAAAAGDAGTADLGARTVSEHHARSHEQPEQPRRPMQPPRKCPDRRSGHRRRPAQPPPSHFQGTRAAWQHAKNEAQRLERQRPRIEKQRRRRAQRHNSTWQPGFSADYGSAPRRQAPRRQAGFFVPAMISTTRATRP